MALTNCPDCKKEVSNSAPACPNCGRPMATESDGAGTQLYTTQETAKRFKLQSVLAMLVIIISLTWLWVAVSADEQTVVPIIGVVIGFAWYTVNRIRSWWHHG